MPFIPNLRDALGIALYRLAQRTPSFIRGRAWSDVNKFSWSMRAHDALTGTLTRAEFCRRVGARWNQSGNATLLLFNADHLARVNQAMGVHAADAFLVEMGRFIAADAEGACVGRMSGDEFAVIVNNAAGAEQLVKRVRERSERCFQTERASVAASFPELSAHTVLTFSVGAVRVAPGLNLMQVLESAEGAVLRAKSSGRNRLCWAE